MTKQNPFNTNSRTSNVVKTSLIASSTNFINAIFAFVYQSVFIRLLSIQYLGIGGLFTNILMILSLAELGITTSIAFRFYSPISKGDTAKVASLMWYIKRIYYVIVVVILGMGTILFPFLDFFIQDTSQVPADISLPMVYVLYLLQTVATYLCSYKQLLLTADQRQYLLSLCNSGMTLLRYILQLVILFSTRSFILVLVTGIATTILSNLLISLWITRKYAAVFQNQTPLSKVERQEIVADTKAMMFHKVGGTVLNGTDSIILSKFAGLVATGIYTNYNLILVNIINILSQLLGGFTSSIGNANIQQSTEEKYTTYNRLLFLNFWIAGFVASCIYLLMNDFILLWIGDSELVFDQATVLVLTIQFYMTASRWISTSYTNGCGLFVKDRIRPLIEATLNLIISIVLVKQIGIAGVFLGTILSHLATVFWREPYLLYRYIFMESVWNYWKTYLQFTLFSITCTALLSYCFVNVVILTPTWYNWVLKGLFITLIYHMFFGVLFCKNKNLQFFIKTIITYKNKRNNNL